jgi:hypothetical protein
MINGSGAPPERDVLRMVGPAALACLLMSYPWLAPGLQPRHVLGVPLVLIYFFLVWALLIGLAARMRADP